MEAEEHPEGDPAERGVREAVAEVREATCGHEHAEQREERREHRSGEQGALDERDREVTEADVGEIQGARSYL